MSSASTKAGCGQPTHSAPKHKHLNHTQATGFEAMTTTPTPAQHQRRILLAVTGLSPQIVTETLYALAHTPEPFVPTEVHLLTTVEGAQRARTALLHPDGGQFHALRADYPQFEHTQFTDAHIHIIQGPDGGALIDIRSPEENAAAADAITQHMAELTRDAAAALHVSIAGGRKTMGFYLGYAFSLYARPQDRLSHVLVSSPFESHPQFFYPPAQPRRLANRDGSHLDTADATITLAEIPVVRLRHGLPPALQQGQASYSQTVAAVQASFAPPQLHIDLPQRLVRCADQAVKLPPAQMAWLAFWAHSTLQGRPLRTWREVEPSEYLDMYRRIVGSDAAAFERTQQRLKDGMVREFFRENNSDLEKALRAALGPAAAPYLLVRQGKRPKTKRGLNIDPKAIELRL